MAKSRKPHYLFNHNYLGGVGRKENNGFQNFKYFDVYGKGKPLNAAPVGPGACYLSPGNTGEGGI